MPETQKRGRLGRRLAIGIYTVALVYLVVVGFASVIPQVFWPEADGETELDCNEGLRSLYDEVESTRLSYLARKQSDPLKLREDLRSWDEKMASLRKRCDLDTVRQLERYRHRVELTLQRYLREEAPQADKVRRAVASPSKRNE